MNCHQVENGKGRAGSLGLNVGGFKCRSIGAGFLLQIIMIQAFILISVAASSLQNVDSLPTIVSQVNDSTAQETMQSTQQSHINLIQQPAEYVQRTEDATETPSSIRFEQTIDKSPQWTDPSDLNQTHHIQMVSNELGEGPTDSTNSVSSKLHQQEFRQAVNSRREPNADWWNKLPHRAAADNSQASKKSLDSDRNRRKENERSHQTKTGSRPPSNWAGGSKRNCAPCNNSDGADSQPNFRDGKSINNNRESLLTRNKIWSLRNQLAAIKAKDKLLATKSWSQLVQLDKRLIDTYKLCFKKKMPLYGGMLYRTRDFTAKMARDLKQERKVLEAMEKQVQAVLDENMANKTLVREYEKLLEVEMTDKQSSALQNSKKKNDNSLNVDNDKNNPEIQNIPTITTTRKPKRGPVGYTVDINEANLRRELANSQALADRIDKSCRELNSVLDDIIYNKLR